jgi:ubiquinone/menaquinone biosynthesis C-methylase UbiE
MTKELTWYDRLYAESGDWSAFTEEDMAHMVRLALPSFKKERAVSVLDVGCGAGDFLATTKRRGSELLVGTDISSNALMRAKAHLGDAEFIVADGQHLPFVEGAFDLVACLGSLEHFPNSKKGAEQMRRVLNPVGTCLIVLPNPYYGYNLMCKALRKYRNQPIEHDLPPSAWKKCLESVGFCVLKTAPANPRSDSLLHAKSIPMLRHLFVTLHPVFRVYDTIRDSLPQILSYHIVFLLRKG